MSAADHTALTVYCDGGARGNPGPAAAGVVILDDKKKVIGEYCQYLGNATNNFAEYSAVLLALDHLRQLSYDSVRFYLDSELVVRQLNGAYRVKHDGLRPLYDRIRAAVADKPVTFAHVPRAQNKLADAQVNKCLDQQA